MNAKHTSDLPNVDTSNRPITAKNEGYTRSSLKPVGGVNSVNKHYAGSNHMNRQLSNFVASRQVR